MAFWGNEFIFDGRSCADFGLMVYDFNNTSQRDVSFTSVGEILTDSTQSRYGQYFYGIDHTAPLKFQLVFGANPEFEIHRAPLDRMMIASIAAWLTGHSQQKWLEICQSDMSRVRYKCVISDLQLVTYASMPWAFSCSVTCDSPYAYLYPQQYDVAVNGTEDVTIFNESSYNGYYYPVVTLRNVSGYSISITNLSDGSRTFRLSNLPQSISSITIDNDRQIITDDLTGRNLYQYFNGVYLRLRRLENMLRITGSADVGIVCEYPIDVGG